MAFVLRRSTGGDRTDSVAKQQFLVDLINNVGDRNRGKRNGKEVESLSSKY